MFVAVYLLLHGVVKVAIVTALLLGTRGVYPWALGALIAFVLFQTYQLIRSPGVGLALLTALDLLIVWLTWREWRLGRELRGTWRDTVHRALHALRSGRPSQS